MVVLAFVLERQNAKHEFEEKVNGLHCQNVFLQKGAHWHEY